VQSLIVQTLLDHLPATKSTPNGWQSFDAPCCSHRGHSADRRRRGGVKLTGNGIAYHCFNCQYTTGYTVGNPMGIKFRRLLIWVGVSETEVNALKIAAIRDRELIGESADPIPEPTIVTRELPANSVPLDTNKHRDHTEYLINRGLDPEAYPYFVSSTTESAMHRRVIVPFTFQDHLVGYTARSIGAHKPKYLQSLGMPYVFGGALQRYEYTWIPVMEGVFDALSINGLATLGNEVSEEQADQLDAIGKTLIVVPDSDKSGDLLIQAAIDYGWSVSWPEWPTTIKDVNEAVKQYGPLFVLRHIWETRVSGATQIKLRLKLHRKHN
jgi:hypothetical protein